MTEQIDSSIRQLQEDMKASDDCIKALTVSIQKAHKSRSAMNKALQLQLKGLWNHRRARAEKIRGMLAKRLEVKVDPGQVGRVFRVDAQPPRPEQHEPWRFQISIVQFHHPGLMVAYSHPHGETDRLAYNADGPHCVGCDPRQLAASHEHVCTLAFSEQEMPTGINLTQLLNRWASAARALMEAVS